MLAATSSSLMEAPSLLSSFSGLGAENATLWLSRFKRYAAAKGWSAPQTLKTFPLFLSGSAQLWFEALSDETTSSATDLEAAFLQRFGPEASSRWSRLQAFNARKMMPRETMEQFATELQFKAAELKKSDSDLLDTFLMGLPDAVRQQVLIKDPTTFDDALKYARMTHAVVAREDAVTHAIQQLNDKIDGLKINQVATTNGQRPSQRGFSQQHREQYRREQPKPRCGKCGFAHFNVNTCRARSKTCHNCGKIGHFQSVCRSAKRRYNNRQ